MPPPHSVLGLPATAPPAEVHATYRALALLFHPDRCAGLPPQARSLAEQRMREIAIAHRALTVPRRPPIARVARPDRRARHAAIAVLLGAVIYAWAFAAVTASAALPALR